MFFIISSACELAKKDFIKNEKVDQDDSDSISLCTMDTDSSDEDIIDSVQREIVTENPKKQEPLDCKSDEKQSNNNTISESSYQDDESPTPKQQGKMEEKTRTHPSIVSEEKHVNVNKTMSKYVEGMYLKHILELCLSPKYLYPG